MLRPSYTELMNLLNNSNDVDSEITSRYTIVIAVAKRARQLIDGQEPMADTQIDKAVSIAVEEMYQGKLRIHTRSNESEKPHGTREYGADFDSSDSDLQFMDNFKNM